MVYYETNLVCYETNLVCNGANIVCYGTNRICYGTNPVWYGSIHVWYRPTCYGTKLVFSRDISGIVWGKYSMLWERFSTL